MAISIFSKEDQASGNFNFGEIKEKKPATIPKPVNKCTRVPKNFSCLNEMCLLKFFSLLTCS